MLKLLLFLLRKALVYARYSHILMKQAKTIKRVQSSTLNEVVTDAISMNPTPTDKGRRLNVFYTTQVANEPPTFVVFVNDVELMHFSYKRYLENQIRHAFGFEGTPIHIIPRRRN